jgi:uncharacterized protein (TIGR03437 family)
VVDNLGAARAYYNSLNQLVVNATASTSGTFGLWIYDQQGSAVFDYEVDFFCKGTCPRPTPVVKSVVNAAHPKAGLCSGAFAAAFGEPFATVERLWEGRDFIGNELPKTVEGVSAKFGEGKASVYYVSSNQVNLIMPDLQPGPSKFRLSTTAGDSALFDVTANEFCPAAFMFDDQRYAVALYSDGVLARTPSINGRSLRPGDVVSLYVTGLGPTSPAYRPGEIVPVPLAAANQVRVTLGGVPATVQYAGLIYAGLYQINVKIPAVAVGEQALSIEVGQAKSPTGVSLLVSAQ